MNITAKIIMCTIHKVADEKQPETKIQAVPLKEQCKKCRAVRLSGSWNFLVKNGIELISPSHRGLNKTLHKKSDSVLNTIPAMS